MKNGIITFKDVEINLLRLEAQSIYSILKNNNDNDDLEEIIRHICHLWNKDFGEERFLFVDLMRKDYE